MTQFISCSTSKVQENTQLSRSRCVNSLREVKSQFKFLTETLQDFGTMPIFKRTFSQDLDLLEQHLTKDILSQTDCKTILTKVRTTFENAFNSEIKERMQKYKRFNAQSFQDAMICNMDSIGKYMREIILHQQRTPKLLKQKKLMQTQDHSNLIQALNVNSLKVDLVVIQNTCSEKEDSNSETASSKSVVNNQFQKFIDSQFSLDYDSQMIDKYFVEYTGIEVKHFRDTLLQHMGNIKKFVAERTRHPRYSGTESEVQNDNIKSGNDIDADDADIRLVYDEEPMAEYPEQFQVKSPMLDSSPDNQTTEYSKQSLNSDSGKGFCNCCFKNELSKLKGNSVDTKFAKTSVLGKPVLQPLRNQSIVRQPNAFKSERPQMSKQRFASQVDMNNNLSRPVTQHYLPKRRESAFAKPDHMIASSESRNSSKNMPRFSLNDMVHNHYLDEARKKTQERDRNSKNSMRPSTRLQSTVDGSKPKPRSTNQTYRSLPVSKSSCVTITAVPKADHSKSSSSFLDSKQFVCSTCHKCVFNANHDACITKLLKEVNSRAKIQSHKTRNSNKPVDQKSHTQKPGRQIFTRHRFSPNKTSAVYEKTSPRSDLRWKPTGRIFKSVGLRWIPTGKLFDSCTSKDDSEPTLGSNVDISNIHESKQTLDLSAGTSINVQKEQSLDLSAGTLCNLNKENLRVWFKPCSTTSIEAPTTNMIELESLFSPLFNEYFNGENQFVSNSSAVTTADASDKRQQQPDSTSSTSTLATSVTADGNFDF
ncbi:hypothetical protein Tco_1568495 [Tanacetum coccineum]